MATTVTFNSALGALLQQVRVSVTAPTAGQVNQAVGIVVRLTAEIEAQGVSTVPSSQDGGTAVSVADAFGGLQATWTGYAWANPMQKEMVRGLIERARAQVASVGVS